MRARCNSDVIVDAIYRSDEETVEVEPIPRNYLQDIVQCLDSRVSSIDKDLTETKCLLLQLKVLLQTNEGVKNKLKKDDSTLNDLDEEGLKNLIFHSTSLNKSMTSDDNCPTKDQNLPPPPPQNSPVKLKVPPIELTNKQRDHGRLKISAIQRILIATLSLLSEEDDIYVENEAMDARQQLHDEEDSSSDLTSSDGDDVIFLPFRGPAAKELVEYDKLLRIGQAAKNKQMGKCAAYWKYGSKSNRPVKLGYCSEPKKDATPDVAPSAVVPAAAPPCGSKLKLMKSI